MQALAVILFAVATLLTNFATPLAFRHAGSSPIDKFGIEIALIILSVVRGGAMFFGLRAVTSGPIVISAVFAVLAMEFASCEMHLAAADAHAYGNTYLQYRFEAVAVILPALLIVTGFVLVLNNSPAATLLSISAVLSVIAGGTGLFVSYSYQNSRNARIEANQKQEAERNVKRRAELDALPADTPVEILLAFAAPSESDYVREHAKFRIIDTDRAVEQLKEALNGPNAAAAKLLFDDVEKAVYEKKREAERAAYLKKRKAEVDAVFVAEGLAGVLSFYARGEDEAVREFVADLVRETPDAETQLVKALAGPHALEAIDALVLFNRVLPKEATFDAVFPAAAKMAERLNSANPPRPQQAGVLIYAIGQLAHRCGKKSVDAHREELMTVYRMARRPEEGERDDKDDGFALGLALGLR